VVIHEQLLKKSRAAAAKLAEAEHNAHQARTEYHAIVRRMHLAGGSLREIAEALDLSHQRVQQMVLGAGGTWWQRVWRSRSLKGDLSCTFCGRTKDQVAGLIAGPKVFICDSCVSRAEKSLQGTSPEGSEAIAPANGNTKARCSFCGKRKASDRALLAGARSNICSECLGVCRQILEDCAL